MRNIISSKHQADNLNIQHRTSHQSALNYLLRKNDGKEKFLLQRDDLSIYLVRSLKQKIRVNTLLKNQYAAKGYRTESASVFSHNPYQFTFEIRSKNQLTGTVSLIVDSDHGLNADQQYKFEIDTFRRKNSARKVSEVSKLAIQHNSDYMKIFGLLFHTAFICAYSVHGSQDMFVEINPRHAPFYERMLGFKQVGEDQICQRVEAPVKLLHLDLENVNKQITEIINSKESNQRKILYRYSLTQQEEKNMAKGITSSLAYLPDNQLRM